MERRKYEQKAVELMNKNPDQNIPPEFKKYLENINLNIKRQHRRTEGMTDVYADEINSLNSLVTIMNRPETKDQSDKKIKKDAFFRLNNPSPPQCKKLFQYNRPWVNEDKTDYKFVNHLELIIKNDGYVLLCKFK